MLNNYYNNSILPQLSSDISNCMIITQFNEKDLCTCMQVCKLWNNIISANLNKYQELISQKFFGKRNLFFLKHIKSIRCLLDPNEYFVNKSVWDVVLANRVIQRDLRPLNEQFSELKEEIEKIKNDHTSATNAKYIASKKVIQNFLLNNISRLIPNRKEIEQQDSNEKIKYFNEEIELKNFNHLLSYCVGIHEPSLFFWASEKEFSIPSELQFIFLATALNSYDYIASEANKLKFAEQFISAFRFNPFNAELHDKTNGKKCNIFDVILEKMETCTVTCLQSYRDLPGVEVDSELRKKEISVIARYAYHNRIRLQNQFILMPFLFGKFFPKGTSEIGYFTHLLLTSGPLAETENLLIPCFGEGGINIYEKNPLLEDKCLYELHQGDYAKSSFLIKHSTHLEKAPKKRKLG